MHTLSHALHRTQQSGLLRMERARSGEAVPVYNGSGRDMWLYSRYSPGREAKRLVESFSPSQNVTVAGIGSGIYIRQMLETRSPVHVTIIPEPIELLVALVKYFDFEDVLSDPRVSVVDCPSSLSDESWERLAAAASEVVTGTFVPLFTRGLATIIPTGIRSSFPGFASAATDAVHRARERVAADLTAQKRFGRLWMRNILLNLPRARLRKVPPDVPEEITVAAAGPGLTRWIHVHGNTKAVLSTDTAAPALEAHHIDPLAVVSVDPSPFSYHHVLCGSRCETWLLDIAANPLLWRHAVRTHPLYNHHPLLNLLSEGETETGPKVFTATDVTQTAVRFAADRGAATINLAGADFAYPKGAVYARATYIPVLFHSRSGRFLPVHTQQFAFAYRSPNAHRDTSGSIRTPGLDAARAGMQETARRLAPDVTLRFAIGSDTGSGVNSESGVSSPRPSTFNADSALTATSRFGRGDGVQGDGVPHGPESSHIRRERALIRERLQQLRRELVSIREPNPSDDPSVYYFSLSEREKSIIHALVPAAVAMQGDSWHEQLNQARAHFFRLIATLYQV